ncbi:hypothetical protein [Novilysobacter defluvii]|uniref:Lipoprotein n=1 Tax=Lysobacter defluvii IMMIB APB-9 = DSM 18482 TaxID=1385515 RepID=A0A0A0M8S9_9GAMM|nr:hypothetical protein [Lysobacter defluvii]KGO99445.1 hypothetical protein N791_07825 [Lysobacter defluvii IMMIB APB-9 = DSM 18482]
MVTGYRLLLVAAALLFSGCALSHTHVAGGSPSANWLDVVSLQIAENGAASPDVNSGECRTFVLDEPVVRRALEDGEPIGRDAYLHQLPWSPCLARGRLELQDGRQGIWTVRQYGTGSVLFDDGAERFFWCRTCTSPPFVAVE